MLSIILASVLMFSVFTSDLFKNDTVADVKLNNVTGKIQEIKNNFFNIFNDDKDNKAINEQNKQLPMVYCGGYPIGLKLYADGVVVVGTESVDTENGLVNTAEKAGIKLGDIIKTINGEAVKSNLRVSEIIEKSAGQSMVFTVERNGELLEISFK